LSEIGDAETVDDITAALKNERQEKVRRALVRALIETGESSTDAFKDLLDSKDRGTREMAVKALAGNRGPWPWPGPQPPPRPVP
jgi:HEAT repeat protein